MGKTDAPYKLSTARMDPFSATVVVTDLPASPAQKSDALMAAFSSIKHKPNALKIKKAKKVSKKKAKTAKKKKRG